MIIHLDGDAFFVGCEMALDPGLRGKPVVTGAERGIASALSYEAKALGLKRGQPIAEIRHRHPEVIVRASRYKLYRAFSRRMVEILKDYSSRVERYSIDECFADLSVSRRLERHSELEIAQDLKLRLQQELGLSFSLGLSRNKTLAKIASNYQKPSGLTVIPDNYRLEFLTQLPLEEVWGVGSSSTLYLQSFGLKTAADLALTSDSWVGQYLNKPLQEIRSELQGNCLRPLADQPEQPKSISESATLVSPTKNRSELYTELSRHVEAVCLLARERTLTTTRVSVSLKDQSFQTVTDWSELDRPTQDPSLILRSVESILTALFQPGRRYRSTGVILSKLTPLELTQSDLFGGLQTDQDRQQIWLAADRLRQRYGRSVVALGSSLSDRAGFRSYQSKPKTGQRFNNNQDQPHRLDLFSGTVE